MKIVIATHNKDKFKELYRGLSSLNVNLLSLNDFPQIGEIVEDGKTLLENALIKAREVYRITGLPAISDDTGLEVDVLNGEPGVFTARFAGKNCSYDDNVNKVLDVMKNIPLEKRQAQFKTVMCYISEKTELTSEGVVEGIISNEKKGLQGFGYDPIFYVPEEGKTFAEMSIERKNIISHRGKAIQTLKASLSSHLITLSKENA